MPLAQLSPYEIATVAVVILMPLAIALLVRVRRGRLDGDRRRPDDAKR